jgi:ArsR family metal-binding transcriptional regulator
VRRAFEGHDEQRVTPDLSYRGESGMLIEGYSDFSMEAPGCSPGTVMYRADFKLDGDVTPLFPYIKAAIKDAVCYDTPHHIQFVLDGYRCALYTDKAVAASFENRAQAVEFIQRLIDFLNDLDARRDSIEPDHTMFKAIPVLDVYKLLPRTNCAECGFPSCMAFAMTLGQGEATCDLCPALNDPTNENAAKLRALIDGD